MKTLLCTLAVALGCPAAFGQQPRITVWPKGLPPGGMTQKVNFGNHVLSISHREVSGHVEIHQDKADVMVIQSGTATLITGGTALQTRVTAPNELQGSRIEGGTSRVVSPGDVIEIPIGVPHQFVLAPGTEITYLLVKVLDTPLRGDNTAPAR